IKKSRHLHQGCSFSFPNTSHSKPMFFQACPEHCHGKDCASFCFCGAGRCDQVLLFTKPKWTKCYLPSARRNSTVCVQMLPISSLGMPTYIGRMHFQKPWKTTANQCKPVSCNLVPPRYFVSELFPPDYAPGKYDSDCQLECPSQNNGICKKFTGCCQSAESSYGHSCESECKPEKCGPDCIHSAMPVCPQITMKCME
ncbi:hypothetical protein JRQ81_018322, partial [Phrynocephalus forsythii]